MRKDYSVILPEMKTRPEMDDRRPEQNPASTQALREAAYHAAGQAVARWQLGLWFKNVSLIADEEEGTLGCVLTRGVSKWIDSDGYVDQRHRLPVERFVVALLAGPVGRSRYLRRSVRWGKEPDYEAATDLAMRLYRTAGTACEFLKYTECQAKDLVKSHWWTVRYVAHELLHQREMSYAQIVDAILRASQPRPNAETGVSR